MATDINERENLQNELKTKRICRFCLTQQSPKLTSIYARPEISQLAPLPVQVMACASIEVFTNDGMPSWICNECRSLFEHSYRFKQMCKRADTLLRQYPLTREWPNALAKPKIPQFDVKPSQPTSPSTATLKSNTIAKNIVVSPTVKILNSSPAAAPEPPAPVRNLVKKEPLNNEISNILNKVGYDDLSMEDVQRLIADVEDDEDYKPETTVKRPPKVLNKSSIRILNKDANVFVEPKLSVPEVKLDHAGNVTVTAIINPSIEPTDSIKNAEPVATDVYPCPHCDRSFPLLQLRDIHMVNHSRERRFQCPDCDKSFFSKYDLQKHEVRHTGDKPYKCVVCERGFSRATLLHRHERIHTEIPKYLCIHCEKPFLSKDEMEQHTARHEKNRPFKCRVCQKTFAFKQGLERHETIHSTVQPYPCQYCEQSFPTPSKLARHLTAHAGKRPYPCKYCNKSYVLSHHLSRHMRSHKQIKGMHVCTECKKIYKTRDDLIYHSAVHSTVSLICTLCHMKLDSPAAVTMHIKQHVEGDAYACEFCDLMFLDPNALVAHAEETHANDLAVYNDGTKLNENTEINSNNMDTIDEQPNDDVIDITNTHEIKLFDDMEEEEEENQIENFNDKNFTTKTGTDKPQILNQIILSSKKDLKYFMLPDEEKKSLQDSDSGTITLNTKVQRNNNNDHHRQQLAITTKKRRIISVDGHLKEVEYIPGENSSPTKRKVVVLAEKKTDIKVEKEEMAKAQPKRSSSSTTKKDILEIANRHSNDEKSIVDNNNKMEQSTKRMIPKVATSTSTLTSADASNDKQQQQQGSLHRLKRIKLSKSQAEAFTKQGLIQIKDGNMILTKETPKTKVSKKSN